MKRSGPLFWVKFVLLMLAAMHLAVFLAALMPVICLQYANPQFTSLMLLRNNYRREGIKQPAFLPLGNIPLDIARCILHIEDSRFYRHRGIDLQSLSFALRINRQLGYTAYGGSTITQQLARTLFLSPERNYLRKYLEICLALEMELFLTKDRILELYINYAEWGDSVYGLADAALCHFGCPVQDLDTEARLKLLTILPNPRKYSPGNFRINHSLGLRYASLKEFHNLIRDMPPVFTSTVKEIK